MAWISHSFVVWVIDGDLLLCDCVIFLAGSSLWLDKILQSSSQQLTRLWDLVKFVAGIPL